MHRYRHGHFSVIDTGENESFSIARSILPGIWAMELQSAMIATIRVLKAFQSASRPREAL